MNWRRVCHHTWVYQGLVYREGERSLPGSSARPRTYSDRYFCSSCLETVDRNTREIGHTFLPVIAGSVPA